MVRATVKSPFAGLLPILRTLYSQNNASFGYRKINITSAFPVDSVVCFVNTYPLDSDLSGG